MSIRNNKIWLYLSLLGAPEMEFPSEEKKAEFEEIRAFSTFPPANFVVEFAIHWARLMEKQMRLHGCELDYETIKKCELLAGSIVTDEENSAFWARGLLDDFWKYSSVLEGYN